MNAAERHELHMEVLGYMKQDPECLLTRSLEVITEQSERENCAVRRLDDRSVMRAVEIVRETQYEIRELLVAKNYKAAIWAVKALLWDVGRLSKNSGVGNTVELDSLNQMASVVLTDLTQLLEDLDGP